MRYTIELISAYIYEVRIRQYILSNNCQQICRIVYPLRSCLTKRIVLSGFHIFCQTYSFVFMMFPSTILFNTIFWYHQSPPCMYIVPDIHLFLTELIVYFVGRIVHESNVICSNALLTLLPELNQFNIMKQTL